MFINWFSCFRYSIMRQCWNDDPSARPSFHQLEKTFEEMVGDGVEYLEIIQDAVVNPSYFVDQIDNLTGKSTNQSKVHSRKQNVPKFRHRPCIHKRAPDERHRQHPIHECEYVAYTIVSRGPARNSYLELCLFFFMSERGTV